ncbi:aminotransferase class III-fold pyridoxal phosphate-dependent enzyme [Xanthobacter sp. 126]|jgi:glutamate-1-semialdehyde 2,1-aminomutase|uniref:aspartate aminotransferase family protein n=1 Tax=Xanthobacter sp. 126 TaxID=1131814 RepID=UPI00045E80F5|nr:aminotransferase class III-fold pyridoxal phosphate-dependent enzyme [Xanthobacter sp. 126]
MTNGVGAEEAALVDIARSVLPAGTFGNMPTDTVIRRGAGGRIWDVSGNEYVDLLIGSGPMLIGHAHPDVNKAVREQLEQGSTFFANNEHGIRLARKIVDALPCAELVRFTTSGTEADAYAMRLARAYRKRNRILKFEGGYHGMSDWALMSTWPDKPSNSGRPASDTAGVPEHLKDDMLVAPYNDLDAACTLIHQYRDELAGVIVEPMQRLLPPAPGFLKGLRQITKEYGIVLIFDEVVTGFRLAYGGGQTYYDVIPDVCTLGKVVGGGFALAAIAGRADIMAHFDKTRVGSDGFMPQLGTLSGSPVAAVAGLATLEVLERPGTYERLFATGRAIWKGIENALKNAGLPVAMTGESPMFDALFTSKQEIRNHRDMTDVDVPLTRQLNALVRKSGVFKSDNKIYVSLAHTEQDVLDVISAYERAAGQLRWDGPCN